MTTLVWDRIGDRRYQSGADRGVLYLKDGTSVPWNGITGVEDGSDPELKSFYMDGIKFLEYVVPGDFVGKLTAYTYPDEFDEVVGVVNDAHGLFFHDQPFKQFNLSYRTMLGDDVEGVDLGYKLHLLYNLVAIPDSNSFVTNSDSFSATEFSWSLTGTPDALSGFRPTVHISVDSTQTPEPTLAALEEILYGTETTDARWPSLDEVRTLFEGFQQLIITDNGNGTWIANDISDDVVYITNLPDGKFQIDHADATYLDPDTFQISTTESPLP